MRNQKEPPEIKKLLEFKASLVQKSMLWIHTFSKSKVFFEVKNFIFCRYSIPVFLKFLIGMPLRSFWN